MKNHLSASRRFASARAAGGLLALLAAGSVGHAAETPAAGAPPPAVVRGPYFGQEPPGKTHPYPVPSRLWAKKTIHAPCASAASVCA